MRKVITLAPKVKRESSYDGESILTSPSVQNAALLNPTAELQNV